MKKILALAFTVLFVNSLYANCTQDFLDGRINESELSKCWEQERRNTLSPEEKRIEDLERENELKRREREAEAEKKRLEEEEKAEKEKDTTWGTIKGIFD